MINGAATDESGIKRVEVNGRYVTLDASGRFSPTVMLTKYGQNEIVVKATDNRNNTNTKSITVIRQREAIAAPANPNERRLALVVGNGDYQKEFGKLRNPGNDARDMEAALKSLQFDVMKVENADWQVLKQTLNQFGNRLKNYDVGLFYYSGHGLSSGGKNYLIPTDAELATENLVQYQCVDIGEIMAHMDNERTEVNILILDACRNNPFTKSWGRGFDDTEWESVGTPSGTFIAYATSPEKKALDGWGDNGAYTSEVLKHIATPGLTIEQVFKRVRVSLERSFEGMNFRQLPWESTSLRGDFYFSN